MEEQNRNKETALGEARRPSSVEEAEAAIEAVLFAMGDSVELGRIAKAIGHDTETTRRILNHMMENIIRKTAASTSWSLKCVSDVHETGIL